MPETHETRETPKYLGVSRAAEILDVNEKTLRRWIVEGKLPAYRIADHSIRVDRADVMKLVVPMIATGGAL